MKTVILDCEKLRHRKDAHLYLSKKLDFPDYYGKNLDALADCLTDLWEYTIVLTNTEVLEDEEFYGRKVLRVLKEAERRNPGLTLKIQKLTTGGEKNAKDH